MEALRGNLTVSGMKGMSRMGKCWEGGKRMPSSVGVQDRGRPAAPAEAFGLMRFGYVFKLGCVP